MRTRLDVAYLGTAFEGWQVQIRSGAKARTVQGELEVALRTLYGRPIRIQGAGRTDAGVHARGQVAHFDVEEDAPSIPAAGVQRALNGSMTPDLRVVSVQAVPDGFHARRCALSKTYRYRYRRGFYLPPHEGLVESLVPEPLNVDRMRAAAARLVGRRDFAPFSITGTPVETTVRTLFSLDVEEAGPLVVITPIGDGVLRGMVRRLAGTHREVGRGRTRPEEVLSSPGPTAEGRGLTLESVRYPEPFPPSGVPGAG